MTDKFVSSCPYCGGTNVIETSQYGHASLAVTEHPFLGSAVYHSVCASCGSIVRSYVKDVEKLKPRKERKTQLKF